MVRDKDLATTMRHLADVVSSQIKKKNGCGKCDKLQFTNYGKCNDCPDRVDCRTLGTVQQETHFWEA